MFYGDKQTSPFGFLYKEQTVFVCKKYLDLSFDAILVVELQRLIPKMMNNQRTGIETEIAKPGNERFLATKSFFFLTLLVLIHLVFKLPFSISLMMPRLSYPFIIIATFISIPSEYHPPRVGLGGGSTIPN